MEADKYNASLKGFLVLSLLVFVVRTNDDQKNAKDEHVSLSDAFLVKLEDCTGSLIADDWVISAAHCFEKMFNYGAGIINVRPHENDYGDAEMDFAEWNANPDNANKFIKVDKPIALGDYPSEDIWTRETEGINPSIYSPKTESATTKTPRYWRKIEKIIMHQSFQGEALSWKGFDFVLIKLSKERGDNRAPGYIIPACLPGNNFPEFENGNVYMAGFGRRQTPHCLTDMQGPEKFQLCGRETWCEYQHRRKDCRLNFLDTNGNEENACIKDVKSPSSMDERCSGLRSSIASTQNETVHLFDESNKYITTCFPEFDGINENPKGWCTTRHAGVSENSRPDATNGWGFCSTDPSQENCNGEIKTKTDPKAKETSFLNEKYCIEKLGDNLRVEQPQAKLSEYNNLFGQANVFCTGRNETNDLKGQRYFKMTSNKDTFEDMANESLESLLAELVFKSNKKIKKSYINGGPNCFGDSGGPLWRAVTVDSDGKKREESTSSSRSF